MLQSSIIFYSIKIGLESENDAINILCLLQMIKHYEQPAGNKIDKHSEMDELQSKKKHLGLHPQAIQPRHHSKKQRKSTYKLPVTIWKI